MKGAQRRVLALHNFYRDGAFASRGERERGTGARCGRSRLFRMSSSYGASSAARTSV